MQASVGELSEPGCTGIREDLPGFVARLAIHKSRLYLKPCFTLVKLEYFCPVDGNEKQRKIVFYKDHFQEFFERQTKKVKAKIVWTFQLIEELQRVPETYLKHIENTDGLYEIRVQSGNDIFRIFCFFDEGRLVVVANGFQKKSQKTPSKEIEKALRIKAEYESEK